MIKIISLGWGVQSFALTVMSATGVLRKVDYAIHADTGFERSETRALAKKWTPWIENHGIKVITVRPTTASVSFQKAVWMPVYTVEIGNQSKGILRRQCTERWKIRPINKWIRNNIGEQVEKWIGFSCDEIRRVKFKTDKWGKPAYSFIDSLPLTRAEIIQWLEENGFDVPQKSSCIICPFHNDDEWHEIRKSPSDWGTALEMDLKIRYMRPGYLCYLHQDRRPLSEIKFPEEKQLFLIREKTGGISQ